MRFGKYKKIYFEITFYRTYCLLWQISGYSTARWKRTIGEEPFWNKKSSQGNFNLARKNIVGLQGSVSIFTLYLKLGATPSRSYTNICFLVSFLGIHAKAKSFPAFTGFILSVSITSIFNSLSSLPKWFEGSFRKQACLFYILSNVHVKFHTERKSNVLCPIFIIIILATFGKDKTLENSHQLVFNSFEIMKLTNFTNNSFQIMKVTNFTCETSKQMYTLHQTWKERV